MSGIVFATHPLPRCERICTQLRARRFRAYALPGFAIETVDPDGLAAAAARSGDYDWLVFVSPTAIELFAAALLGQDWPLRPRVAVMGTGSAEALRDNGYGEPRPILLPTTGQDSQALLAEPRMATLDGCGVLIVRGVSGRDELGLTLRERGARVEELRAYRRVAAQWPTESNDALDWAVRTGSNATFVFTMTDAVGATHQGLHRRSAALATWACAQRALAIHPRIASALRERGWTDVRLVGSGMDALAGALESA